ncbi:MAG: hypothetical protein QOH78_930 [Verrucomicrobiota bacterium]
MVSVMVLVKSLKSGAKLFLLPSSLSSSFGLGSPFRSCSFSFSLSIPRASAKAFGRCLRSVLFLPERQAFDEQRQKLENEHDHDYENDSGKRCSSA